MPLPARRFLLGACATLVTLAASLLPPMIWPAQAGPLLERLMERRAERQQDQQAPSWLAQEPHQQPGKIPSNVRVQKDVPYGGARQQQMDIYLPPQVAGPIIVMVHGGAWRWGDKGADRVVTNKVARWVTRGVVLVSINTRLLPQADPLAQAEDVAQALTKIQEMAPHWGADAQRLVLMGHSAGAHLVALLSANPGHLRRWLTTVSLDSAAMDVTAIMQRPDHPRLYDNAFGKDPQMWAQASPIAVLQTTAIPMLLVCSSVRPDHPCGQAQAFAQRAHALGVKTEIVEVPLSHGDINGQLGMPGNYTAQVEDFLRQAGDGMQAVFGTR